MLLDVRTTPVGVWVDADVRGRYTGEAIQSIATSYGWLGEPLNAEAEFYEDATLEALDYMSSLSPEGYWFDRDDHGHFGLWNLEGMDE